jgi:hypothetical protein
MDQTQHRIGTKPKQAIIVPFMFGNTRFMARDCPNLERKALKRDYDVQKRQ